jgi:hypothetical protein
VLKEGRSRDIELLQTAREYLLRASVRACISAPSTGTYWIIIRPLYEWFAGYVVAACSLRWVVVEVVHAPGREMNPSILNPG